MIRGITHEGIVVSMPHAAFYVVQQEEFIMTNYTDGFNAARSILCGATQPEIHLPPCRLFQCRTQHFMWCNIRKEIGVVGYE